MGKRDDGPVQTGPQHEAHEYAKHSLVAIPIRLSCAKGLLVSSHDLVSQCTSSIILVTAQHTFGADSSYRLAVIEVQKHAAFVV
jgi:hypothetical protein